METKNNSFKKMKGVKVRYTGMDDPESLRTGKIYNAAVLENGWFGIMDESNEVYAFSPEFFEIVE